MYIEEINCSVGVDHDLSVHISDLQCLMCFIIVLEKDVLLRTRKECAFPATNKRQIPTLSYY